MTDKILQYFSSFVPLIDSGDECDIQVTQTVDRLTVKGPSKIKVRVSGPQTALTQQDLAGVYPAPDSTESPAEFLPHIALTRRTLPWERNGPLGEKPWLALIVLKKSEGATIFQGKVSDLQSKDPAGFASIIDTGVAASTAVTMVTMPNNIWTAICPDPKDLPFLCHARRVPSKDKTQLKDKTKEETPSKDKTMDLAIVVSNRLPDASANLPEEHVAILVSLDHRRDLYAQARGSGGTAALLVLHSWSFTPSGGGDFEQVVRSIAIRPNGGVLRFGNLPENVTAGQTAPLSGGFAALTNKQGALLEPLEHRQEGNVIYRSPLTPFRPMARSNQFAIDSAPEEFVDAPVDTPRDYSHAVAFELGRLLAIGNQAVLEDLRDLHGQIKQPDTDYVIPNKLPMALQKRDWVTNPSDVSEHGWAFDQGQQQFESVLRSDAQFLGTVPGDVAGIGEHWQKWGTAVPQELASMQAHASGPVTELDFENIRAEDLVKTFPEVVAKGKL